MKVRLTTFLLAVFLLWSSLAAVGSHASVSKLPTMKVADEAAYKAVEPDKNFVGEKLTHFAHILFSSSMDRKEYVFQKLFCDFSSFTHRSDKFYLLYRVLRN